MQIGPNFIAVTNRQSVGAPEVELRQTNDQARRGEVGAGENRVDEQHAAIHVARHHEGSGNQKPNLFARASEALPLQEGASVTRAVSTALGSSGALVGNTGVAGALQHGSALANRGVEGLAVFNVGLALYQLNQAKKDISQANEAQEHMRDAVVGKRELSLDELKANAEALAKGQEAQAKRVDAGLTLLKNGGTLAAAGMRATGIAASAAPLVAGGAAGLVSAATGGYQIYSAGKQKTELTNKMQALDQASSKGRIGTDVAKLKAAADDIKASREKHISNTKWGGIANVGYGIAALALLGVALVVSAPVILPILSLGLMATGIAVGVTSVVRSIEKKRSEDKINTLIDASVQAGGKLDNDGINGLLSDKKFKKTATRDHERVGKINEGVFAIDSMLKRLSETKGEKPLERLEIISFLTDSRFADGPQKQIIKEKLHDLNPNNFEQSRGPILAMLAKQIL